MASRARTTGVEVSGPAPDVQQAYEGMMAANEESPYRLDPTTLEPGMHYRFARLDDGRLAKLFANRGYRFVNRFTDGVKLLQADAIQGINPKKEEENPETADPRLVVGNMVLVCCPAELHQRRQKQNIDMANARLKLQIAQDRTLQEAMQQHVEIIHEGGVE